MKLIKLFTSYSNFVNGKNHLWVTFGYAISAVIVTILFIYFPDLRTDHFLLFFIINMTMVLLPISIVVSHIVSFRTTFSSLRKVASLYLQIILMFGVIYYFGSASSRVNKFERSRQRKRRLQVVIKGIDTNWVKLVINRNPDRLKIFKEALFSFQDCMHFSLITSTTVGYGDMVPGSPAAKLLVDIQVLVSCFLLAFGVGSALNADKSNLEDNLEAIKQDLENRLTVVEQELRERRK